MLVSTVLDTAETAPVTEGLPAPVTEPVTELVTEPVAVTRGPASVPAPVSSPSAACAGDELISRESATPPTTAPRVRRRARVGVSRARAKKGDGAIAPAVARSP